MAEVLEQDAPAKPRGSVRNFASLMEQVLQENDWKGGWGGLTSGYLLRRLSQELRELRKAVKTCSLMREHPWNRTNEAYDEAKQMVAREAADVANFSMMIAEVLGDVGLANRPKKKTAKVRWR